MTPVHVISTSDASLPRSRFLQQRLHQFESDLFGFSPETDIFR